MNGQRKHWPSGSGQHRKPLWKRCSLGFIIVKPKEQPCAHASVWVLLRVAQVWRIGLENDCFIYGIILILLMMLEQSRTRSGKHGGLTWKQMSALKLLQLLCQICMWTNLNSQYCSLEPVFWTAFSLLPVTMSTMGLQTALHFLMALAKCCEKWQTSIFFMFCYRLKIFCKQVL